MRYAVKSKKKIVKAYRLGAGSQMEAQLIREGAIRRREDGSYELFSQEAVNGRGEAARTGDYFKVDTVDGRHYPYPNSREYFEENHIALGGDEYEQKSRPLAFWQASDPMCEEIRYLVDQGKLILKPELSAARDAAVIFYSVDRDGTGGIADISFNFAAAKEFEESYEILPDVRQHS